MLAHFKCNESRLYSMATALYLNKTLRKNSCLGVGEFLAIIKFSDNNSFYTLNPKSGEWAEIGQNKSSQDSLSIWAEKAEKTTIEIRLFGVISI